MKNYKTTNIDEASFLIIKGYYVSNNIQSSSYGKADLHQGRIDNNNFFVTQNDALTARNKK